MRLGKARTAGRLIAGARILAVVGALSASLPAASPAAAGRDGDRPAAVEPGTADAPARGATEATPEHSFLSEPNWFERHWIELTATAVGVTALLFDEGIQGAVQGDLRGDGTNGIADVTRNFGDGTIVASMIAGGYLTGLIAEDDRLSSTAFMSLQSFVFAGGLTEGIKRLAHRDRPNQSDDAYRFNGAFSGSSSKSFVSGHATHAFAVATVIAREYGDEPLVPPIAYTLASLVAASRVNDNKHWVSDVILGSTVGYAVGRLVHELNTAQLPMARLSVMPLVGPDGVGVMISWRF